MPIGGFEVAGVGSVQLEPVRAEPDRLNHLLDAQGEPFDDAAKARRRDALLALLAERKPDIHVIEAFPFGRRSMRFELVPLLDRAREVGVKVIAASVRDILQQNNTPGRAAETAEAVERWFDVVLVHGDEASTPLAASFALADRIAARTVYTGLVAPEPPQSPVISHGVIVSVGGGAVGAHLIEVALQAMPHSALSGERWLFLTGPNMDEPARARLSAGGNPLIEFRSFVGDLPARLAGARLSISQAGYNTMADVLVAGCRAVLVPFEHGGETEQFTRACAMEASGRAVMLRERDLTPVMMGRAIDLALGLKPPSQVAKPDGARQTAQILLARLADGT